MLIALDLGNRYLKTASKFGDDILKNEMIVCYKEISETDYNERSLYYSSGDFVKYKDRYYLLGEGGTSGIDNVNKAHPDVLHLSRLFTLVGLSKDLESKNKNKGNFNLISGTPIDDYESFKNDYINLFKVNDIIEVNGTEYKIKVDDVKITKQSASVLLSLPERKLKNYILFDFGGGTLDVCYAENGVIIRKKTIDFSLNELYVELAQELRNLNFPIDRGSKNDSRFQRSMENLKFTGSYKGLTTVNFNVTMALSEYVSSWFQPRLNKVILEALYELNLNDGDINNSTAVFFGGGAKLLEAEINNNDKLKSKKVAESSPFRNVLAYLTIGNLLDWSDSNE